ncbi:MAG: helix-turn-helix transcriptional regulator [Muribaculaceae bacterium]|nr:helix-turn-helix transcriptional regulator [Muribaculaceae bacterium]
MEKKGTQSVGASMMTDGQSAVSLDNSIMVMDNLRQVDSSEVEKAQSVFGNRFPLKLSSTSVMVVINGTVKFSVNFRGYDLTCNTAIIISSGAIIERMEITLGTRFIFLSFAQDFFPATSNINHSDFYRLCPSQVALLQLQPVHVEMFKAGYNMLRTILSDSAFEVNRRECASNCVNLLGSILAQGSSNQPEMTAKASRKDEIVTLFLQCVHENYREHRDLGFYADQLGLSLKYMSHVVYEHTGRHPSQWIKDYVILDAKTMLSSGRYTVQQVAEELNFPNQSFFGKYFKEAVGISPKKWK